MAAGTILALSLFVTAGTAVVSYKQNKRAQAENKKAAKAQRKLEAFRMNREKKKQIRQQRILQAQLEQQAVTSGTAGSSVVAGGVAGTQTAAAGNIFSMNTQQAFGETISGHMQRASDFQFKAQTTRAVGQMASTIFQGYKKPSQPTTQQQTQSGVGLLQ